MMTFRPNYSCLQNKAIVLERISEQERELLSRTALDISTALEALVDEQPILLTLAWPEDVVLPFTVL